MSKKTKRSHMRVGGWRATCLRASLRGIGLLTGVLACSSEPKLRLKNDGDAPSEAKPSLDPAERQRREMMLNLRHEAEDGTVYRAQVAAQEIEPYLVVTCNREQGGGLFEQSGACLEVQNAQHGLCRAHKLLEIIQSPVAFNLTLVEDELPPNQTLFGVPVREVTIEPPTVAAAYDMANRALWGVYTALTELDAGFRNMLDDDTSYCVRDGIHTDADGDTEFRNEDMLTAQLVDAYQLIDDIYNESTQKIVAYADAQMNTGSDSSNFFNAFLRPELSRSHAAHMLLGGNPGLRFTDPGSYLPETFAGCSSLNPDQAHALKLIREAAVSPRDVLDETLSINDFVNGNELVAGCDGSANPTCGCAVVDDNPANPPLSEAVRLAGAPVIGSSGAGFDVAVTEGQNRGLIIAVAMEKRVGPTLVRVEGKDVQLIAKVTDPQGRGNTTWLGVLGEADITTGPMTVSVSSPGEAAGVQVFQIQNWNQVVPSGEAVGSSRGTELDRLTISGTAPNHTSFAFALASHGRAAVPFEEPTGSGIWFKGAESLTPSSSAQIKTYSQVFRNHNGGTKNISFHMPTEVNRTSGIIAFFQGANMELGPFEAQPMKRCGSVKQRLIAKGSLGSAADVQRTFGLTLADFSAARSQIKNELITFLRPLDTRIPDDSAYPQFVATGRRPELLPPVVYAALASQGDEGKGQQQMIAGPEQTLPDGTVKRHWSLAVALDLVGTNVAQYLELAEEAIPAAEQQAYRPLQAIDAEIRRRRRGRMFDGGNLINLTGVKFDELLLVKGEAGLECATKASVEGFPCTDQDLSDFSLALEDHGNPGGGYDLAVQFPEAQEVRIENQRYYFVEAKPGRVGLAGGYESIGGFTFDITDAFFVPELDEQVRELIAVDEDHCARPRVSCAAYGNQGTGSFDRRLPLENELIDDRDGYESSWKYFLELARTAAQRADTLASEVIQSTIAVQSSDESIALTQAQFEQAQNDQIRSQLEGALRICGSNIDPERLLREVSDPATGKRDLSKLVHEVVPATGECEPGYRMYGGKCLFDILETARALQSENDPDADRLVECIDSGKTLDFATIGGAPLCVWQFGENPRTVCQQDSTTDYACPVLAQVVDGVPSCTGLTTPPGSTPVVVGDDPVELLDLLKVTNSTAGLTLPATATGSLCDQLAQRRTGSAMQQFPGGRAEFLQHVVNSGSFHSENLRRSASRLNWSAEPGGYASITVDGLPHFTTGTMVRGPTDTNWPCAASARAARPDGTLFGHDPAFADDNITCLPNNGRNAAYDMTQPENQFRVHMNRRMWNAVMAARAMTDVSLAQTTNVSKLSNTVLFPGVGSQVKLPGALNTDATASNAGAGTFLVSTGTVSGFDLQNHPAILGETTIFPTNTSWWKMYVLPVDDYREVSVGGTSLNYSLKDECEGSNSRVGRDPLLAQRNYWNGLSGENLNHAGFSGDEGYLRRLILQENPGAFCGRSMQLENASLADPGHGAQYNPERHLLFELDRENIWDGLELLCYAASLDLEASPACGGDVVVEAPRDIATLGAHFECIANEMERGAGLSVVVDFPTAAAEVLSKVNANGTAAKNGGTRGATLSTLRSDMAELAAIPRQLASVVRDIGPLIKGYELAMTSADLSVERADIEFFKEVANQVTQCLTASNVADAIFSAGVAPAATCANSLVQIGLSERLRANAAKVADVNKRSALNDLATAVNHEMDTLNELNDRMTELIGMINANLLTVDGQAAEARRALDQVMLIASEQLGVEYLSNVTLRRRLSHDVVQYQNAFQNAQWQADLAKRAIEQRLGVRLSDMKSDLPLVDAPTNWESTVCKRRGQSELGENFSELYIGEYVSKLERVVESYLLEFNFKEGRDTAVISLRDDVVKPKESCLIQTRNLLSHSGDLSKVEIELEPPNLPERTDNWRVSGCEALAVGGVETVVDCISIDPLPERALPVPGNTVPGFSVKRGPECAGPCPVCPGPECSLTDDAALVQRIKVTPGTYRLSYYTQPQDEVGGTLGYGAVTVLDQAGGELASAQSFKDSQTVPTGADDDLGDWERVESNFTVLDDEVITLRIGADSLGTFSGQQELILAGFMLENTTAINLAGVPLQAPFIATAQHGLALRNACAARDGGTFRLDGWQRRCLNLCADGYGSFCPESGEREECFQELVFDINQKSIELGDQLPLAGFAKGNFNYRIDSIGLNFVGTGIRDCADAPEGCYNSGFVQYTLDHTGGFFVRNHFGGWFESHLFNASIEHARGLGAERYVSNPIASTERDLLQDYMRQELQGRPLHGNFRLRVWETPGVNFNAIEDVQIVMNYGYWTRFD